MSPAKRGGRKPPPSRGRGHAPAPRGAPSRSPSEGHGLGGDQVEGRQAVRELLLGGRRVREVWVATDLDDAAVVEEILELARDMRVTLREVSRNKLMAEARTDAPQGVLAKAAPLRDVELDELAQARGPNGAAPFLVCADGLTDPGNLGALLRSASCAGATGVVLPRHRAVHITPTVTKAAAGAIEHLPMALVGGIPSALARMRELGVWVVGLDMVADRTLFDLGDVATEPIAVVLGAEGRGISRLARQRCDLVVRIPLVGPLESLNVAAAGALACYEVARQRLT
ncbi:MAG TPA: 23S rRNA (guanosine(2251)-2'-O)-methyltransferase RlmB [Acidimicrobiales bacterium]|nr:23S rRNA (guanosine(2251)-2'-O)-methyltransferase RlmB [Acidimicrobiales bacterium]